ncbi:signal peptidase I [Cellulomonas fimi]|uniref:Signal peptidase I n=1 Tax=Cellulomonas fimi (strain ATCC 484 / DSM 20113 / JCM 1341 / CCUG 24087 / LMG 16345 / NBRC 15513 / NCIMB 8980 / NCTC 7547 / NRS-133) TaxID=590998 RepID=F4GYP9_CELFA|nr:signal peptidase I [Cellulomonas fimi]AEE44768.1 peptidase S26B, signal peptidase [Cellulomonas fimi ATCC 484]NNH06091.1 signal peptidase I [Cellulomonas fimi]VEH27241.1 signal peptidase I [Cellulomonas fimi]
MTDTTPAPGAHRARRVLRALVSVLFYAAAAVAAWFVWPTNLGGCTTLTVVSGSSMEPTYVTGDLVVSRCGAPQVGDVVVYRPHELDGARIIHRLVGGDGTTGWVVQGDNNDWTDPFTPTDEEILGVAALHVPKVGLVGRLFTSPWVWGSCMLVALGLLVWPSSRDDETDPASPDLAGAPQDRTLTPTG